MARRNILSVGYPFPGAVADFVPFLSDQTLLDADVIVFQSSFSHYDKFATHHGKPKLRADDSFRLMNASAHWKEELRAALEAGKTIFVFLTAYRQVWVSGKEEHRTSRDSSIAIENTIEVDLFDNYASIPIIKKTITSKSGTQMEPAVDLGPFTDYWRQFGSKSAYKVCIRGQFTEEILVTKSGNRCVGARLSTDKGNMFLIPPIAYDRETFSADGNTGLVIEKHPGRKESWSQVAKEFGHQLASCMRSIHEALRDSTGASPKPDWVGTPEFRMQREEKLISEISAVDAELKSLGQRREDLERKRSEGEWLRWLLYENGKQLESAILKCLKLLGFKAENFKDSESEFDALFESEEGRFLGEAEGKDSSALRVAKLDQLDRNLKEDFARDEVTERAKGVLFGNAFRFEPVSERDEFFTEKCVTSAKLYKVALVRTPDLFDVSNYLLDHSDKTYSKKCRQAIFRASGKTVQFPKPPKV